MSASLGDAAPVIRVKKIAGALEQTHAGELAFLTAVTFAAAILRFYKIGEWSFWIDELYTLPRAQAAVTAPIQLLPLSSLFMGMSLNQFGISEWSARLAPAIIGIVTLPLLYFPVRSLWGKVVAAIFVLSLAVSPWHLYWSQNARFYTTLFLLYTLAFLAFAMALQKKGNSRYMLLLAGAALLALAVPERLVAFFLIVVLVCYFVVVGLFGIGDSKLFSRRRVGIALAVAVLIPVLIFLTGNVVDYLSGRESDIAKFWRIFVGNSNTGPLRLAAAFLYHLGLPSAVLAALGAAHVFIKRDSLGLLLVTSAAIPPAILIAISPFMFAVDRYAFISVPSWILLAALPLKDAFSRNQQHGRLLALGFLSLLVLDGLAQNMLYYTYQNGARPRWKEAFAVVETRQETGDLVFTNRPEIGGYYLNSDVGSTDGISPEEVQSANHKSWFVIGTGMSYIDPELHEWLKQNGVLVASLAVHVPGKVFDMQVYSYTNGLAK